MGIITTVTWSEYAIGAPDGATRSHRVKLRGGGTNSTVQIFLSGTDNPKTSSWPLQANPPSSKQLNGMTFQFAFWSVKFTPGDTGYSFTTIAQSSKVIVAVNPSDDATYTAEAHAYYVWVPNSGVDGGPPTPYVLIDAFDSTLNDFIPDDPFVAVSTASDPGGTNFTDSSSLSQDANDLGYIDTDAAISLNDTMKIAAIDLLSGSGGTGKRFSTWLPIMVTGNATVGQSDPHDIVVGYDDTVVAFAIYQETTTITDTRTAGPTSVDWTIYQEVSQQLTALTQQLAGQEERMAALSTRFDAVAASIMALSARVDALQKMELEGQAFIRNADESWFAGEQVPAVQAVKRRGFFARLFHRGA